MSIIRSRNNPAESISGLRRAVVFTFPLLALFFLDSQVLNPLAERVYPFLYNVLADRGIDLDLAWFYAALMVGVGAALALGAMTVIGLRLYGLNTAEIGWKRTNAWPAKLLVGAVSGALFVPAWGIAKHMSAVVFFQRLPYFSIGSVPEWGRLTTAPGFNELLGTWSYGAAFEEIFYRGLVYAVLKRRFGRKAALPVSALAFAWAHYPAFGGRPADLFEFCGLACLGLLCAGLREWDGTLLAPIVAHLTANFFGSVVPIVFKMV